MLKEQDAIDRKNPKKAAKIRRFIIVEAIYMNTGEMCPLAEIIELRRRYKLRLILDESVSFGTLGKNGRGIIEHLNLNVSIMKSRDPFTTSLLLKLMFISSSNYFSVKILIWCVRPWKMPLVLWEVFQLVQHSLLNINVYLD